MSAYPFGGHPTFAQYLAWAKEQGCQVNSGYTTSESGRIQGITRIVSPNGEKWVIETADQTEFLVPTTIARLDRRLGMKSPFFSIDDSWVDKKGDDKDKT